MGYESISDCLEGYNKLEDIFETKKRILDLSTRLFFLRKAEGGLVSDDTANIIKEELYDIHLDGFVEISIIIKKKQKEINNEKKRLKALISSLPDANITFNELESFLNEELKSYLKSY